MLFLGILAGSGYGISQFSLFSSGFYAAVGIAGLNILAFTGGIVARYCLFRDPELSFYEDLEQTKADANKEIVIEALQAPAKSKVVLKNGKTMKISRDIYESELPRIHHLCLGNKVIVNVSRSKKPTKDEILERLYSVAGSRKAASGLAHLLHADVLVTINNALEKANLTGVNDHITNRIKIKKNSFKLERELVFAIYDLDSPCDETLKTYLKAKLVVSGALKDLHKNPENLNVRVLYTEESSQMQAAIHAKLVDSSVED